MKIKKGDTIKVLYGKDAGKRAQVIAIDTKKHMVVADGVNVYKRHIKGDGRERNSEIVNIVKPMPVSKVMLVCPFCGKATRIGMKVENGKKERFCKRCKKVLSEVKKEENKEEKKIVKKKKVESKSKKIKNNG